MYFLQTYADPYNEEAIAQYHKIDEYMEEMRLVEAYYRGGDHRAAAELATRLLEVSPWSAQLRQLRAECYIAMVIPSFHKSYILLVLPLSRSSCASCADVQA